MMKAGFLFIHYALALFENIAAIDGAGVALGCGFGLAQIYHPSWFILALSFLILNLLISNRVHFWEKKG